jgi:hypothetical protein
VDKGRDTLLNGYNGASLSEFLRNLCDYHQDNWALLLPAAQLAINSRDATHTGVNPLFLDHGYYVEPFLIQEGIPPESDVRTPGQKAEQIVAKLKVRSTLPIRN